MRPADSRCAARGVPARCEPAAAQHGLARRQPPPGDALLVLAARVALPPARRRRVLRARRASIASTRSSRTTSARRRIRPTPRRRCSRSTRRCTRRCARCTSERSTALPTPDDRRTTTLEPGELILEVELPPVEASVYLKAMDRKRWSFPLVGVAAARFEGGTRVALAGVAPVPWLLDGSLDAATPLPGNAYKLEIAQALRRRAEARDRSGLDCPAHGAASLARPLGTPRTRRDRRRADARDRLARAAVPRLRIAAGRGRIAPCRSSRPRRPATGITGARSPQDCAARLRLGGARGRSSARHALRGRARRVEPPAGRTLSAAGAEGLLQVTAVDRRGARARRRFAPAQNILAGARYLRQMIDRFHSIDTALAAYNAGPSAVDAAGGIAPTIGVDPLRRQRRSRMALGRGLPASAVLALSPPAVAARRAPRARRLRTAASGCTNVKTPPKKARKAPKPTKRLPVGPRLQRHDADELRLLHDPARDEALARPRRRRSSA